MKLYLPIALACLTFFTWGAVVSAADESADAESESGVLLDDFTDAEACRERWITVNDGVMGGKSKGGPTFEDGRLNFAGTINTDGGGFSSIRTRPDEHDLTGTAGLLLRVKGDGRTYEASLRTDAKLGRWWIPVRAEFETTEGEWVEVFVPYDAMTPSIMGRVIEKNPPALELDKVKSFGIMLADGQDGDFTLEVDWIKAVERKPDAKE